MTRRDLMRLMIASAAAEAVDVERLLWTPTRRIFIPPTEGWPHKLRFQLLASDDKGLFRKIVQWVEMPKVNGPRLEAIIPIPYTLRVGSATLDDGKGFLRGPVSLDSVRIAQGQFITLNYGIVQNHDQA